MKKQFFLFYLVSLTIYLIGGLIQPTGASTFTAVAEALPVDIPDTKLRAEIEMTLGKLPDERITQADMARLTQLYASESNINNLTGLEQATNLTDLGLEGNRISDISPLAGLTHLTGLYLSSNSITDISPVAGLTRLTELGFGDNNVTDLSALAGLTKLTWLGLDNNNIMDISPLAGLTKLTRLRLWRNNITDLLPLAGLTRLTELSLWGNNITDISPLLGLIHLDWVDLRDTHISDLSALVANTGLGDGDVVRVDGTALSYTSINTHIPSLRSRGVEVHADNLKPPTLEYTLSIPAGLNLIHVPLRVTAVDGVAKTLESISDLYDALGGADAVNHLMTYDTSAQDWLLYFGVSERGTANDRTLTGQMGIIAGMKVPTSVRLTGKPLGNNNTSTIDLTPGLNLVGLPLREATINRVSDLLNLDGIRGNALIVLVTVNGEFKSVGRAGDPGDIAITGGQGFILTAQRATTVTLSGEGWMD